VVLKVALGLLAPQKLKMPFVLLPQIVDLIITAISFLNIPSAFPHFLLE